jgi:uncharacterized protein YbaR (Trm112 family)
MNEERKVIVCDECKKEFFLRSVQIQKSAIEIGGQQLELSYFKCPECGRLYRITLMDNRYNELVDDLEDTKKRIRRTKGNNNYGLQDTLNKMVFRKLQRLRTYTEKLNAKYSGTFEEVSENGATTIKYLP